MSIDEYIIGVTNNTQIIVKSEDKSIYQINKFGNNLYKIPLDNGLYLYTYNQEDVYIYMRLLYSLIKYYHTLMDGYFHSLQ